MIPSNHTSIMKKCPALKYMLLLVLVNIFFGNDAASTECTSETYNQSSFDDPQKSFSPYQKIFVEIRCDNLDVGDHTVHVNWVHHKVGIVRSDKKDVSIKAAGSDHTAYFWFQLSRQGPIKSTLTNYDFYPGHLGEWHVEVSLGEDILSSRPFSISENN